MQAGVRFRSGCATQHPHLQVEPDAKIGEAGQSPESNQSLMMQAVLFTRPGGPEVLELAKIPLPDLTSPTALRVRLYAAGVNPLDTKLRQRGTFYPDRHMPILGCDGAGVVETVGAAVTRFRPGDAVYFCNGGLGAEPGTYAEYTIIEEAWAVHKPRSLSFSAAAAAPLALLTAWESLFDRARLHAGQTVLIHAGAGGVGHLAIQLARQAGAHVVTTVSSPAKAAFCTELGAACCLFYRERDFVAELNAYTAGRGVDVALDTVGGAVLNQTFSAVAHYGDVVTLLEPGPDIHWKEARMRNLRVSLEIMLTPMLRQLPAARQHQVEILQIGAARFDDNTLKVHVSETFPLAQVAEAHRRLAQGGVQGKLVLTLHPDAGTCA